MEFESLSRVLQIELVQKLSHWQKNSMQLLKWPSFCTFQVELMSYTTRTKKIAAGINFLQPHRSNWGFNFNGSSFKSRSVPGLRRQDMNSKFLHLSHDVEMLGKADHRIAMQRSEFGHHCESVFPWGRKIFLLVCGHISATSWLKISIFPR